MRQIVIIGGGLAGLTASNLLSRKGFKVILFERRKYPFHRVCGEYISNEVKPFLKQSSLFPSSLNPAEISKFQLTSTNGKSSILPLDLGGFGVSRYKLDYHLAEKAVDAGVDIIYEKVINLHFNHDHFEVLTEKKNFSADVVLGAFGKRSILDKSLNRNFINKRSPYIGVKYHVQYDDHDQSTVALHNFRGGYCGINRVEDNTFNLCYLGERKYLKNSGSIERMEEEVLMENPFLEQIFSKATFLFDKPEVINEISFETKIPVEKHVLMCGDAAGMITPLCGNGMAIAIHSAKIAAECIQTHVTATQLNRVSLERDYTTQWNAMFKNRLRTGRQIQRLFGAPWLSNTAVSICGNIKPLANFMMRKTHGEVF